MFKLAGDHSPSDSTAKGIKILYIYSRRLFPWEKCGLCTLSTDPSASGSVYGWLLLWHRSSFTVELAVLKHKTIRIA